MKTLIRESLTIVIIAAGLAFVYNAVSTKSLPLIRTKAKNETVSDSALFSNSSPKKTTVDSSSTIVRNDTVGPNNVKVIAPLHERALARKDSIEKATGKKDEPVYKIITLDQLKRLLDQKRGILFDARNDDGTPADNNVFAALNNLRLALTNNDTDGINAAVQSVQLASNQLNTAQAFYGSVENRIQDATSYANSFDLQLKTELSQKVDADVTSAAMTLNQGTIQLQAAFQMEAKMPHTSLFDYIG